MRQNEHIAAVILSAGRSSRMGKPKSLLDAGQGISFLELIVRKLKDSGCDPVVAVMNEEFFKEHVHEIHELCISFAIVPAFPSERIYSAATGLEKAGKADYFILSNVDNPSFDAAIPRALVLNKGKADYLVPSYKGKNGHPILISSVAAAEIVKHKYSRKTLREVLSIFQKHSMEVDDTGIITDINTPQDYAGYLDKLLKHA